MTGPAQRPELDDFVCESCGLVFSQEPMGFHWSLYVEWVDPKTGEKGQSGDFPGEMGVECPRCGGVAMGQNVYHVSDGENTVTGFAASKEDAELKMRHIVEELRALRDDATVDEIVGVLESRGVDYFGPLIRLLRTANGTFDRRVAAIGLLLAILPYIGLGPSQPEPPEPPEGITREQMRDLLDEYREQDRTRRQPRDDVSRDATRPPPK